MPLYAYRCDCCGNETEAFNRIAERHTSAPECGRNTTHGRMAVKLTPNLGYVQRDCHYICPASGEKVTTNRQRTRIMQQHNLIDANDFPPAAVKDRNDKIKTRRDELAAGLRKPLIFQ